MCIATNGFQVLLTSIDHLKYRCKADTNHAYKYYLDSIPYISAPAQSLPQAESLGHWTLALYCRPYYGQDYKTSPAVPSSESQWNRWCDSSWLSKRVVENCMATAAAALHMILQWEDLGFFVLLCARLQSLLLQRDHTRTPTPLGHLSAEVHLYHCLRMSLEGLKPEQK